MTQAAQGDKVALVTAGVATPRKWRGGRGMVACSVAGSINSAELQMQADDGVWVDVKDIASGAVISFSAIGTFQFMLPACPIRINGTTTGATVFAVGV